MRPALPRISQQARTRRRRSCELRAASFLLPLAACLAAQFIAGGRHSHIPNRRMIEKIDAINFHHAQHARRPEHACVAHQMPSTFSACSSCASEFQATSALERVEDVRLVCLLVARVACPDDGSSLFICHLCHSGTVTTSPHIIVSKKKGVCTAHFLQRQDGNTLFRKWRQTLSCSAQAIVHMRITRFGHGCAW